MAKKTGFLGSIGYDEKTLNRLYMKAKITLSPYDYTLSDRAIPMKSDSFSVMSSTFYMNDDVEQELYHKLKLDNPPDLELLDTKLPMSTIGWYNVPWYAAEARGVRIPRIFGNNVSYLYKHNDMLMNDDAFEPVCSRYGHKVVEPLMRLSVLLNEKGRITDQLLLTRLKGVGALGLDNVVNLDFINERLDKNMRCGLGKYSNEVIAMFYLQQYAIGMDVGHPNPITGLTKDWIKGVYYESIRQNIIEIAMFLCEIYRACKRLSDDDLDSISEALFIGTSPTKTPLASAFGEYDAADRRFKSEELDRIAAMPNEERFKRIPEYVEERLRAKFPTLYTYTYMTFDTEFPKLNIPEVLIRVCSELHFQAWQDYRVKHFALLLRKCAERKIDIDDLKEAHSASSGGSGASSFGDFSEKSFGDMSKGDRYDTDPEEPSAEPSAKPSKHSRSGTSALETMDNLLGACDKRYDIEIEDVPSNPGMKDAYFDILKRVDMITKQLTKQIREIKTYNTGGKVTGKPRGKIDPHIMYRYRTNPKIFYDNTYKVKEMDLAFGVILDQSGSMRGDGIDNGRISLILLHHVLNALRINHAIIGHTSDGDHNAIIKRYVMFNEDKKHTLDVPYSLVNAKALNGNCDSGALNYMEQYIKRTQNKDKIVLIFSDGEPTECSETELRQQVRHMEANGIHVIGLGINFENIGRYYPDHANGCNLKEMIDILIGILKRYVLEKKD